MARRPCQKNRLFGSGTGTDRALARTRAERAGNFAGIAGDAAEGFDAGLFAIDKYAPAGGGQFHGLTDYRGVEDDG